MITRRSFEKTQVPPKLASCYHLGCPFSDLFMLCLYKQAQVFTSGSSEELTHMRHNHH